MQIVQTSGGHAIHDNRIVEADGDAAEAARTDY
jgi:hypothetical protein